MDKINIREQFSDYIFNHCLEEAQGQLMYGKRPGERYQWQYYLSRLLYDPSYRFLIGQEFMRLVENEIGHYEFQIAGREWSAVPLIVGLQNHLVYHREVFLSAFMIKRERKNYGIHNWIEGEPDNLPVLIVDDICNSTNSFFHCKQVCNKILHLETLPFIFSVLNKFNPKIMGEEAVTYDKYLGKDHKALYIIDGEDINEARIRFEGKRTLTHFH